ncbi:MAG: N-6 DNA methylase [Chloroflexi bacterium]|nr:N-6 DNA methylase [Chloroflexota bacterium]
MTTTDARLTQAVEDYLTDLRKIRSSGGGTAERSYYPPLINLLNSVGGALKPKVFCISELADQGAGHPDVGLYAGRQVRKGQPRSGELPECGVLEVKAVGDDAWLTADSDQVSTYWEKYRLVLVTNTRDFVLLGEDAAGNPVKLETFRLADSAEAFEKRLERPRVFAREAGAAVGEYLGRALSHRATLVEPRDLARLLASYARDGLGRVEAAGDAASLKAVREALEDALGVHFEDDRGAAFFRSTLVQTLFYGVFSAWVLWARQSPPPSGQFNWHESAWHLRAPVLRALFQQLSEPGRLHSLGLVEVLDWAAAALDRVDRDGFFERFSEGEAVPYFYEPFLAEFDPQLRKDLGVWYTPIEVVRYMVARVDRVLKDDLEIVDGLAADNVYVLDPCCGTGAYLGEVLRRIEANLREGGAGALTGARVKRAAMERVFGFEIMPAPFVVAHLQVGLTMQDLGAPFSDNGDERAGVFLTNALTGWEPTPQKPLPIPELEEERERADRVKRDVPVLVILGNPPYNGFAGMAIDEERELSEAYRETQNVRRPEGQGLNDLYVRFFRMAERRIAEKTGRGVVCFISNYSWLDGLSFTGMRERYLDAFDVIRIDNLHGDKFSTGKTTPDGEPDPSIFSTREDPVGIQVGTAIATLVRKADHEPRTVIRYRDLWGTRKRERLQRDAPRVPRYARISPQPGIGLPFKPVAFSDGWFTWPSLPDLFPASFPGVKTSRDSFLVDVDRSRLTARLAEYFDPALSHEELARRHPSAMRSTAGFDARSVRDALLDRGGPVESGFVRYVYKPFDTRWLYWEANSGLLDRARPDYMSHVFDGNMFLEAREREAQEHFSRGAFVHGLADNFGNGLSSWFPALLRDEGLGLGGDGSGRHPNLSPLAQRYLDRLDLGVADLFYHALATLHDPVYRETNAGALKMEWPRIPLRDWPDGKKDDAASWLVESARLGRELAGLLDSDVSVEGVTTGSLRPEIAAIAVPTAVDDRDMADDDFALQAGWGYFSGGDAVMPGRGSAEERSLTTEERAKLDHAVAVLGETTLDISLNERAYWRNVPAAVWDYKLGGYQVLKKWLSYRESAVLDRALRPEEVQHFTDTARRIAAILLLTEG